MTEVMMRHQQVYKEGDGHTNDTTLFTFVLSKVTVGCTLYLFAITMLKCITSRLIQHHQC